MICVGEKKTTLTKAGLLYHAGPSVWDVPTPLQVKTKEEKEGKRKNTKGSKNTIHGQCKWTGGRERHMSIHPSSISSLRFSADDIVDWRTLLIVAKVQH